jgi:hypothetical protein
MNTQEELEHIDHILTMDAFRQWLMNKPIHSLYFYATHEHGNLNIKQIYLTEQGLPIDSIIKGL